MPMQFSHSRRLQLTLGCLAALAGSSSFALQMQDSSGSTASQALTIKAAHAVSVTTSSLPPAVVGVAYSQTLTASGGAIPLNWTVASGSLPNGISLSATGTISGTPSTAGGFPFTVQVKDAKGATAMQPFSLTVAAAVSITTTSLPGGTAGQFYSQTLSASGGTGTYTWSLSAGALPAGLSLSSGGTIAGTPSSPGTPSFTVRADSGGSSATKGLGIAIAAAVTITTLSLPVGDVGVAYQQTLTAQGGTGADSWSVTAGSLPAGLSLSPAGIISGTPSAGGTSKFTALVTDAVGAKATAALSIAINATLTVTTSAPIAAGSTGVAYTQTFTTQGGTPPYSWQASGTLPAGISLSASSGVLSGTPTQSGTFLITVKVSDATGAQASASYSLVIAGALTISTAPTLPQASTGVAYSDTLQATGGQSPYQWALTAGSLPAGLNLSATGQISGTPTASGSSTFTLQVTDASSNSANKQFTLTVAAGVAITSTSLPAGSTQISYSQTVAASGGSPPYSWSVTSGALPDGLTLQAATGALSGTPSTTGTFTFTVTVTDSNSLTANKQFTLSIGAGFEITTSPSLPNATAGAAYSVTLNASGGTTPYSWSVTRGTLPGGLTLNASSGTISGTPTAIGTFPFTVQAADAAQNTTTAPVSIVVATPTLPALSIGGFSGTASPLQQLAVQITLAQPYSVAITGTLSLTFAPAGTNGIDDPAIQFSTGGRGATFTIPANSTQATFSAAPLAVQTGSVEGAITISVASLAANGASLPLPGGLSETVQVAAYPPAIQSIALVQSAGGIQLQIVGVADTRELTQVTVSFQPASGTTLETTQFTVSLAAAASAWFSSSNAAAYGGQFSLMLPFSFSGNVSLSSVSAVLSSSVGSSLTASANY
jgi:large repetitive protein